MPTLEQILKKRGLTDQEITEMAPMLSNAKFRQSLETELGEAETSTAKMKTDMDEYDRWFTEEITPEHQRLVKEHADAVAEAAANKARFEAMQRSTMGKQAGAGDAGKEKEKEVPAVAADASKFVTADTFNKAFESTGDAIAVATNIVSSHMQLFPGQYLDMEQLRAEAKAARKPVKDFWESKYKVADRRAAITAKAESDKEAKIRADERQKMQVEWGGQNPNLQTPMPSNNPFVIKGKSRDTGAKQPWERTSSEISRDRIEKAIQKAAGRGELASA